jgi:DNA topoisomerase-1
LRRRVERDLSKPGLPREKVLATVVRLLDSTGIRIGNDEYARTNRSFGLTTLRDRHVEVSGSSIRFEFRGKSGKTHQVSLSDRRLARIVQRCQDIPGEDLFQYIDEDGVRQTISSGDVNEYLRQISTQDFTAKDFRTPVCRKFYVHPCVFDSYTAGTMLEILQNGTNHGAKTALDAEEAAVVWLLRQQLGVGRAS